VTPNGVVTPFVTGIDTTGLAFGPNGNLFAANFPEGIYPGNQVYEVTPVGVVSTFATGLSGPAALAFDGSGNLYVAEFYGNDVIKITPDGVVSTFASGIASPAGLAFDGSGNLYVGSQTFSGYIDKITPAGVVSTFATGIATPGGLAFDGNGNLYVTDYYGQVDKITPGGVVSTFATGFNTPQYPAFDSNGNLYVPEHQSGTVSRVGPRGGIATLFATGFRGTEAAAFVPNTTAATSTTLTSDLAGRSVYGQPVTFTATVSAAAGTPTGSVQLQIDGADFGAAVPLTNGVAQFSTASLSVGLHNITAAYTSDNPSYLDSQTLAPLVQPVTYGIKVLFDQGQARQSGSTIPVEIQLTDYYGNAVSSAGVGVQALYVVPASNPAAQLRVSSPGNSQPGNDFRFTGGRYQYNLDTTGLADGTYTLYFMVDGDPLVHSVSFVVG
jgi:sugar lactone lactonase YvrE